jgi:peroxiredoxin
MFAPTPLVLIAAVLGLAWAGLAVVPGARSPATAAGAEAGPKAPPGRGLSVEDAMRELDLVRPPRARRAPDIALPALDGTRFRLADHRGKVVLVNFWATWCPPCLEEMPALERLWQRHRQDPFVLVAVALDANTGLVAPFVTERKLTFPVVLDPRLDAGNAYSVRALPTTVVVDRQGDVRALALGPRVWDNDAASALVRGLAR